MTQADEPQVTAHNPAGDQNEALLTQWLRREGRPFFKRQLLVVGLGVAQFIVQVAIAYGLAAILAGIVIQRVHPDNAQWLLLSGLFIVQLVLFALKSRQKRQLSKQVLQVFNHRLHGILKARSLAVIRDYSVASWQSFFLQRVPALQHFYCDYQPQQRLAGLIPILVLIAVWPISWLVALLLVIAAPLIPLFMWVVGMGAAAVHRRHFVAIERLTGLFLDRLNGRQLLHIYNRVAAEQAFFSDASEDLKKRTLKVVSLAFLSASVLDFFATIAMALVAVFVGFNLLGELSFGFWQSGVTLQEGLFLLLLAPLFFTELKTLGRYYHAKAEAVGAADVLNQLFATQDHAGYKPQQLPLQITNGKVLSDQGHVLVSAQQLRLAEGDRILLQGDSGAGKSSLLEGLLAMRPLATDQGMIALNRQQVAWLTQQPVVLPGTVAENLTLGHAFREDELHQALAQVELTDWWQGLPQGMETPMGDYPPLSGGQRQRLAIARLILFDKDIVFLDEPTANLDADQQQRIIRLLQQLLADKTLIWIAHDHPPTDFFSAVWQLNHQGELLVMAEALE